MLISLLCLPSLFASGMSIPVGLTLVGGGVSSNTLSLSYPSGPSDAVGVWEISGPLTFTATQSGTVVVTYDYSNSSAGGMYAGQNYTLAVSADDYFWSADTSIVLQSLDLTSTISRCIANNADPCGPNNPDPASYVWSVSASYDDVAGYTLGTLASPLHVVGGVSVSAQIPISNTFAFDQTSTMTFTDVHAGDVIHIDLPDTTELDAVPEPATFWLVGLAGAGFVFPRRRARFR